MADTKNVPAVYEGTGTLIGSLPAYQEKVRQLLRAAVAPETRRAYASRLKRFFAWCLTEGVSTAFPTSPEVLAAYVASLADSRTNPRRYRRSASSRGDTVPHRNSSRKEDTERISPRARRRPNQQEGCRHPRGRAAAPGRNGTGRFSEKHPGCGHYLPGLRRRLPAFRALRPGHRGPEMDRSQ